MPGSVENAAGKKNRRDEVGGIGEARKLAGLETAWSCKIDIEYCLSKALLRPLPSNVWPINVDFDSLQLEKVRLHIRRNFPIRKSEIIN